VSFRHPEGDKVQAAYALEMADIRGPDAPTGGDGRGCYKAVMCTNVHTCRDQICPQAGMHACTKEIKRNRWKGGKDGLDKSLPPSTVLGRRPVHAVQQLWRSDGGDPDLLRGAELTFQTPSDLGNGADTGRATQRALQFDEDRDV